MEHVLSCSVYTCIQNTAIKPTHYNTWRGIVSNFLQNTGLLHCNKGFKMGVDIKLQCSITALTNTLLSTSYILITELIMCLLHGSTVHYVIFNVFSECSM